MERFCCILLRRNSFKTTFNHSFKWFLTSRSVKNAGFARKTPASWRHFNTFSRSLSTLIDDKSELERRKDESREVSDDFFGFDGSGVTVDSADPTINSLLKYGEMFKREPKPDEDKVYVVSYGTVRFDSDNLQQNYDSDDVSESNDALDVVPRPENGPQKLENDLNDLFNEHYFSEITKRSVKTPESAQKPYNYIEEQYFGDSYEKTHRNPTTREATYVGPILGSQMGSDDGFEPVSDVNSDDNDVKLTNITRNSKTELDHVETNKTMTAFDYVRQMRAQRDNSEANGLNRDEKESKRVFDATGLGSKETAKLDSKGFRIYKNQTKDLENEPEMDVIHLLKSNILYNENEIVAINKPYGLQVHPGAGHRHSLTKYLPQLAKFVCRGVSDPELYTVHRLDIETTGVLLLAKTQEMAKRLHDLFADGKIGKTYWALTKGVPSPSKGIVDIPMAEGSVDGKMRMVLRPELSDEAKLLIPKYSGKTRKAVTSYHVVSSHGNAALVELKPSTGVKHQLRVHLAFGLGCPVLGDHKYSHLSKLAPQKLPSDMLQRLLVRQSKVRYIPMHLHSRGVSIPDVIDGRDIVIGARLPKYFLQNMEKLEIRFK